MARRPWMLVSYLAALVLALASVVAESPVGAVASSTGSKPQSTDSANPASAERSLGNRTRSRHYWCRQRLNAKQRGSLRHRLHSPRLRAAQCRAQALSHHRKRRPRTEPKWTLRASTPTVFGLSANTESDLRAAEHRIGLQAGVVGVFIDWKHDFPTYAAENAASRGASLLISWEPQDWNGDVTDQPDFNLDHIRTGVYDDYIARFAQAAAATHRPVFVRLGAEMNGDWHPWSPGVNGNTGPDFAATWRYIVDKTRAAGGTNIKWMFNPIVSWQGSYPMSKMYPGNSYVDWVGLDGYNWSNLHASGWQSFDDVFRRGLRDLRRLAPNKPLAIPEIGCAPGTNKAQWVADALTRSRQVGARMVVWFEHNKETDWRLSSNAGVARAAHKAATQRHWVSGGNPRAVQRALGL